MIIFLVPLIATFMLHLLRFMVLQRVGYPPIVLHASYYIFANYGPQLEVLRVQPHKSELIPQSWYESGGFLHLEHMAHTLAPDSLPLPLRQRCRRNCDCATGSFRQSFVLDSGSLHCN